jgi:hypothetical protein
MASGPKAGMMRLRKYCVTIEVSSRVEQQQGRGMNSNLLLEIIIISSSSEILV